MSMKKKDAGRQAPKSPMPRGPFSRSENRDFGNLEPPDPGQLRVGIPDSRFPAESESGIGAKFRISSRSRPNWDRENPGYFPGQIGAGRGGNRGKRGLGTGKSPGIPTEV
jgi:hypothetical protein